MVATHLQTFLVATVKPVLLIRSMVMFARFHKERLAMDLSVATVLWTKTALPMNATTDSSLLVRLEHAPVIH